MCSTLHGVIRVFSHPILLFRAQVCVGCPTLEYIVLYGIIHAYSHTLSTSPSTGVCRVSDSRVHPTACYHTRVFSHPIHLF